MKDYLLEFLNDRKIKLGVPFKASDDGEYIIDLDSDLNVYLKTIQRNGDNCTCECTELLNLVFIKMLTGR